MTQPSPTVRNLSSREGDRRIRVLVANPKGKGFDQATFSEAEVEFVVRRGDDLSALLLRSGVKIPVALSYEQLEQKIYERDFRTEGPVLDLRDVTGEAAKPKAAGLRMAAHASAPHEPSIGAVMPDGTVFAGISPDTDKPMYVTPTDASLTMAFNDAQEYAAKLNAFSYKDWHVPTKAELNVLFNNRAAIGGFDTSGSDPSGWYWSASQEDEWDAWAQRFSDGDQDESSKVNRSSLRCIR